MNSKNIKIKDEVFIMIADEIFKGQVLAIEEKTVFKNHDLDWENSHIETWLNIVYYNNFKTPLYTNKIENDVFHTINDLYNELERRYHERENILKEDQNEK